MKSKNNFVVLFLFLFICLNSVENFRILVPKTISSIPIIELDGISIGNNRVIVEYYDDHSLAMAELIGGKVELLVTGFTQGLSAYNENKNILLVNSFVWGLSSIVVKDKAFDNLDKLAGKKISVPFQNSPLDLQLRYILEKRGLIDKVSIEYVPFQQAISLLISGKLDAISLPEPLVTKLILTNNFFILSTYADLWEKEANDKRSPQVSIFTNLKTISRKKKVLQEFRKRLDLIIKGIEKNKENLSNKYKNYFDLETRHLLNSFDRTIFGIFENSEEKRLTNYYIEKINFKIKDYNFYFNR